MHGILSRRFGLQGAEEELMHGFESLLKVARLMFLTPKWSLRVFCLFWVGLQSEPRNDQPSRASG